MKFQSNAFIIKGKSIPGIYTEINIFIIIIVQDIDDYLFILCSSHPCSIKI